MCVFFPIACCVLFVVVHLAMRFLWLFVVSCCWSCILMLVAAFALAGLAVVVLFF